MPHTLVVIQGEPN